MKSNIFLVAIFLLIAGGIYMFTKKDKPSTQEETALSQQFTTSNAPVEEKGDIPPSEWKDALIGTWNFFNGRESSKAEHTFTGEIEFLPNGTFIRHVTHKFYIPYYDYQLLGTENYDDKLAIVEGGVVKGKWSVSPEKGKWTEKITSCNIIPSFTLKESREHKGYSACKKDFSGTLFFGTHSTGNIKISLDYFRTNQIRISGTNFKEGAKVTYIFNKKDD